MFHGVHLETHIEWLQGNPDCLLMRSFNLIISKKGKTFMFVGCPGILVIV